MAVHSKHTITAYNAHMLDGHHADEFILAGGDGASLVDLVYPIGAIYMSMSNVEPSLLFGGVWERWGQGRVPVSFDTDPDGTFTTLGRTGGNIKIQAHYHYFTPVGTIASTTATGTIANTTATGTLGSQSANHTHTVSGGSVSISSSGAHTHTASQGAYKVGSGSGSTYKYFTNDGTTAPQSISSSGAHTHTVPAHSHTVGDQSASHTHTFTGTAHNHTFTGTAHTHTFTGTEKTTGVTGEGSSGNMPPYIVCNMWVRTG